MKEIIDACGKMEEALSAIKKAATLYSGDKIDEHQDGNHGQAVDGEQDFGSFDNLAKKQILKQKMMTGG